MLGEDSIPGGAQESTTCPPIFKAIHVEDKSRWQIRTPRAQGEGTAAAGAAGDDLQTPWVRIWCCLVGVPRDGEGR